MAKRVGDYRQFSRVNDIFSLSSSKVEVHRQRDLCRVERSDIRYERNRKYGGYRKDILKENLTERDEVLLVCEICKGIMREASISSNGEQFCSCCNVGTNPLVRSSSGLAPNVTSRRMISLLKCCCPLNNRGCEWLGTLKDCENHLATCGYVYDECKLGCREVLRRNKLKVHEIEDCPLREVRCGCCGKELIYLELPKHLDECPRMEVSCELCGIEMCRENITEHLEKECGMVVVTCKLGCGVMLTRDELKIHVTDTCVQRIIPCKHCKGNVKFCDVTNHIDVCLKVRVSCELCGKTMYREDMTQHLEVDCVEKEIECPFAKYRCEVGLIKRKYLSQHLEDKETKHLGLKLNAMELEVNALKELVMKQNAIIGKLSSTSPK